VQRFWVNVPVESVTPNHPNYKTKRQPKASFSAVQIRLCCSLRELFPWQLSPNILRLLVSLFRAKNSIGLTPHDKG